MIDKFFLNSASFLAQRVPSPFGETKVDWHSKDMLTGEIAASGLGPECFHCWLVATASPNLYDVPKLYCVSCMTSGYINLCRAWQVHSSEDAHSNLSTSICKDLDG